MSEGAGEGIGRATGVEPGALSALLQEVAAAPDVHEAESVSLRSGTVIGRFEVIRELGRGGFGVVYEAKDRDLGRQVAVKVVRPGRITEEVGKVSREAEAIARLAHPNLVTLFDVGQSDGRPYLVFELLRGKTLDLRIEEGPLPVQEAVHIATEVARGLAHAHAEGVIHRDLKPANVFVTNKGQVKILDFGMAHAFGRRRLSGGTPAYMAPEQWEDDPEDERTDVFALGVMLYRMLTGEYPFPEGEGRWAAEPATPRKLDVPGAPELSDLVERMLDRTPKVRPRDGAAVLAALAPIEEKLRARPADGAPPVRAKKRKATFGDLLAELKRRHVFRVMVGYGVFAFAVLQIIEPIMHGAELPDWTLKAVLVVLALGFPVSVILAWIFDLTAQGVRRTPSASGPGAPSFGRSRLLVPLAVSAAVLAIAAVGASAWYASKRAADHRPVESGGAGPSVAVLPFKDLSPEQDQEYFSDGIAEEILSRLSKVKGLRVPGRVSSFHFKRKDVEPGEIARKLRVTHLLEGSVRRSGSRVRIRAEVVRASDGETVWNQTFERDLTDVLAVQDEIARSAVRELAPMLLSLAPPPTTTTVDPEAYRLYLLGRSLLAQDSIRPALDALRRSVTLDPRFAPAQALLAAVTSFAEQGARGDEVRQLGKAGREAAERAVALDPSHSYGYVSRAWYRMRQDWDWKGASDDLDRALAIDPANEWALNTRAILARALGRPRESLELQRRAVDVDPLNAFTSFNLASHLAADGRLAEARELIGRSLELSPGSKNAARVLGYVALLDGKAEEALAAFDRIPEPARSAGIVAALHSLGRDRESREAMLQLERDHPDAPFLVAGARAWRGEADKAFAALDRALEVRDPALTSINWSPFLGPIRGDARWKTYLRKMNLPVDGDPGSVIPSDAAAPPSIAVLAFADMSPGKDQEYFADGVAEEILNALAQFQGLKVIGRTSSFSFKGKNEDLRTVGQKLGVATILEGSVRKHGEKIRVTAQLIRSADGSHLWSQTFERPLADVFAVQDEVARDVARALQVRLLPGRSAPRTGSRTTNPAAYSQYLLGLHFNRQGNMEGFLRARESYEKAIALDPGYVPARARLGLVLRDIAYRQSRKLAETRALYQQGLEETERAIAIGPDLADGYAARGLYRLVFLRDWKGALEDTQRAVELDPGDNPAHRRHALVLASQGKVQDAIAELRLASDLDPLSPPAWVWLATLQSFAGQLDEAERSVRRVLDAYPQNDDARDRLATIRLLQGRPADALQEAAGIGKSDRFLIEAIALHELGREAEARKALAELRERAAESDPALLATVYSWMGDRDRAFEWLDRALELEVWELKFDPMLRKLHADPRWAALLRKMNLPVD